MKELMDNIQLLRLAKEMTDRDLDKLLGRLNEAFDKKLPAHAKVILNTAYTAYGF